MLAADWAYSANSVQDLIYLFEGKAYWDIPNPPWGWLSVPRSVTGGQRASKFLMDIGRQGANWIQMCHVEYGNDKWLWQCEYILEGRWYVQNFVESVKIWEEREIAQIIWFGVRIAAYRLNSVAINKACTIQTVN